MQEAEGGAAEVQGGKSPTGGCHRFDPQGGEGDEVEKHEDEEGRLLQEEERNFRSEEAPIQGPGDASRRELLYLQGNWPHRQAVPREGPMGKEEGICFSPQCWARSY